MNTKIPGLQLLTAEHANVKRWYLPEVRFVVWTD
jgi:hypothetical protein